MEKVLMEAIENMVQARYPFYRYCQEFDLTFDRWDRFESTITSLCRTLAAYHETMESGAGI